MKDTRKARVQSLVAGWALLPVLGVTAVLFLEHEGIKLYPGEHPYYRAINPRGIVSIQDHLKRWGHPSVICRRNYGGTNVYVFAGLTNKLPAGFPSGPPAYVYSESGKFLDWTFDLGDDSRVHERWPPSLWPDDDDQKISNEEIDRLFAQPNPLTQDHK